ncbi:hypothetical protein ACVWZ0_003736 [Erwinia sp. TECH1]
MLIILLNPTRGGVTTMKNNFASIHSRKENGTDSARSLLTEGVTASVWTPDYVLRLRQNIHLCGCSGCDGASPLLQFRWNNHVRHSADISCNRAAAEILSLTASCTLSVSEDLAEHLPELSAERLQMNQHCLRLFAAFRTEPVLLLYALYGFIRQSGPLDPERRAALLETWLQPAGRQRLVQDFCLQQDEHGFPPVAGQRLEALPIWLLVDSDARLHKLKAMRKKGEETLRQTWRGLQKASSARRKILGNFLFYELCHNFFPGHLVPDWENNFADLCRRALSLLLLLTAVSPELDKESLSALFAASHRAARREAFS